MTRPSAITNARLINASGERSGTPSHHFPPAAAIAASSAFLLSVRRFPLLRGSSVTPVS